MAGGDDRFSVLPWERLVWSAAPHAASRAARRGERYYLTDARLVVRGPTPAGRELLIQDLDTLTVRRTWGHWLLGTADLVVGLSEGASVVLAHLRQPQIVAAINHLLTASQDLRTAPALVQFALAASVGSALLTPRRLAAAAALLGLVTGLVAIRLQGSELAVSYPQGDAIYPGGVKRDPEDIVRFMEEEVMPFARQTLGPLVGGAHRVTCETCHGEDAEARAWRMPGVALLPYPKVRFGGLERYVRPSDPQVRNAVYADLAQDDTQAAAGYMRQVVMPGMARILGRPAYDFTRSYRYNRSRFALGCYHCHRVS